MPKEHINPAELFSGVPLGFSQAIACNGGKTFIFQDKPPGIRRRKLLEE
jgi:hypothetical protein